MIVVWSPRASRDAERAATYIARDRPLAARRWLLGLFEAVERLELFPLSGHTLPDAPRASRREIPYQGYRILYQIVSEERIEVTRVIHARRKLRKRDVTSDE